MTFFCAINVQVLPLRYTPQRTYSLTGEQKAPLTPSSRIFMLTECGEVLIPAHSMDARRLGRVDEVKGSSCVPEHGSIKTLNCNSRKLHAVRPNKGKVVSGKFRQPASILPMRRSTDLPEVSL